METQKLSLAKFATNYGIILGVIFILINVIMYVTGMALEGKQWPQYLYYLIYPALIMYSISQYKQKNANFLSLGEAIKIGVLAGVVSAIIYIVYSLIFLYFIDPGFMDQLMEVAKNKMFEKNPDMTEEMAEQSMKFFKIFTNPFISSAFWIFMSALFGLIYGLIGGAIMKKENTHA
ncbi:MAG: DUF4199 domain-containing protein [Aquaticitalea sp.]